MNEQKEILTLDGIEPQRLYCEHCGGHNMLSILSGENQFNCVSCGRKSSMKKHDKRGWALSGFSGFRPQFSDALGLSGFSGFRAAPDSMSGFSASNDSNGQAEGFASLSDQFSRGGALLDTNAISKTFNVSIRNTSSNSIPITIFKANEFLTLANFGLPSPITIQENTPTSSYAELLSESRDRPFTITGLRVESSRIEQLDNMISIDRENFAGQRESFSLSQDDFRSIFAFRQDIIDIRPLDFTIDGNTGISFELMGETSVSFVFFVSQQQKQKSNFLSSISKLFK